MKIESKEPIGGPGRFGKQTEEIGKEQPTESEKATIMLEWAGKIRIYIQREMGIESIPENGELENAIEFWEKQKNEQLIVVAEKSDQPPSQHLWKRHPVRYWALAAVLTKRSGAIIGNREMDY